MPTGNSSIIPAQKQTLPTPDPLRQKLKEELQKSLIVSDEDRTYWEANYLTLPLIAVQYFYDKLKEANQIVDETVAVGLESKPELIKQVEQNIKNVRAIILQATEEKERTDEDVEKFLEENLSKL